MLRLGPLVLLLISAFNSAQADFRAEQQAVTHTAIRSQGQVGFCWAYTLAGLMEGEAKKDKINVLLSPEYLGFYHMYFQLQKHLSWFGVVVRHLDQNNQSAFESVTQDAYERIYVRDRFYKQGEGNDEALALNELEISGAVPQEVFNFKLGTQIKDQDFELKIKNFIKAKMLVAKNLDSFKTTDGNGMNETLFEALAKSLDLTPPKPSDSFTFQGKSFTPKTFVTDYLKFDPGAFVQIAVTPAKQQRALNLIRDTLKANDAVPIGFEVFMDPNPSGDNALKQAGKTGDFSNRFCPGGQCKQIDGGHEVLGVNWTEDSKGNVTSIIIKNSWGHQGGRNDRGQETREDSESGFFILESDYLADSSTWFFIVPKAHATGF